MRTLLVGSCFGFVKHSLSKPRLDEDESIECGSKPPMHAATSSSFPIPESDYLSIYAFLYTTDPERATSHVLVSCLPGTAHPSIRSMGL